MFFRKKRTKQKERKTEQAMRQKEGPQQSQEHAPPFAMMEHGGTRTVQKQEKQIPIQNETLCQQIEKDMNNNPDLQMRKLEREGKGITIFFLKGAMNEQALHEDILQPILNSLHEATTDTLKAIIPIGRMEVSGDSKNICTSLINGCVFVHIDEEREGLLFNLSQPQYRTIAQPINEASVLGPKQEFTESLETNCQVLRQIIPNQDLVMESFVIGRRAPKEIRIVYMKSIADEENVKTLRERIGEIDVDDIIDSAVLISLIEENEYSLFPQLIMTELPQRVSYSVLAGKVAVLVNGSPMAIVGPVTFFSFFESTEDLYFRWNVSTFLRLLRFVAVFISVSFTPLYVAALTYHYEVIPSALLVSIGQSRSNVPFPPVMEALLLEGLIELLREAGARLPTKIGQTIGIVGGIVIGQAAVQAGFTSNILIIVVALSALASFTAPNYVMGTVIRVIRFPLILLAGIAGGIGLTFGLTFILIHLLRVTSLNRPYLEPLYPFHFKDMVQNFMRIPHRFNTERPTYNQPKDAIKKKSKKKPIKKDIDE